MNKEPSDHDEPKAVGGIAPFGYRWKIGALIVDEKEAPVRKLIYELFIKHKRKKTVARLLNDLGYRTRNGALFSDTTIDRLIRDSTAKGIRIESGREIKVEGIVSFEIWEKANKFLGEKRFRQPVQLFTGIAVCDCGGKMLVAGNADKYVCIDCRKKIGCNVLEAVFLSQMPNLELRISAANGGKIEIAACWQDLTNNEKRAIIENLISRIVVGRTEITIESAFATTGPEKLGQSCDLGRPNSAVNESQKSEASVENNQMLNEPLMNEIEAATFLGISRMTLLRKRNAGEIGFYRVGFRVLYSKGKHLLPFLNRCEK